MIFQKRLHLLKKNSTDFYKFRLQVQNLQNICLPFLLIKLRNLKLWIFPREDAGWHLRLTLKLKYFHSLSFLLLSCIDLFEWYLRITRKTKLPNLVRMNTFFLVFLDEHVWLASRFQTGSWPDIKLKLRNVLSIEIFVNSWMNSIYLLIIMLWVISLN